MQNPINGVMANLPLLIGDKRSFKNMDWRTSMPENMLAIAREVKGGNGYVRAMPGLVEKVKTAGVSRGVHWNTVKSSTIRVMGNKIYVKNEEFGEISGEDRTPMAHSNNTFGVVTNNQLILVSYNGDQTMFSNWTGPDDPTYEWGSINDICHLRQRYIFSVKNSDTFWISDLEDETHPDKIAPAYRAESMPDGIVAIRSWRDYVVCFGTASIEFFGLTGDDQNVYASQPSYTVDAGTLGRETVCQYLGTFAFITSPFSGEFTVGIMNPGGGSWEEIASAEIKKILKQYSVEQLQGARLEPLSFDTHKLLILHLPDQTLVYDQPVSVAQGVPVWTVIKTGIKVGAPHRAIDYMNEGNRITVGDKTMAVIGELDESTSSQYGEQQEIVLYTPILPAENAILSDLQMDSSGGGGATAETMFVSCTEDGIVFGHEIIMTLGQPKNWTKRVLMRKVCRVRSAIGFKFRVVGTSPVTLSFARVRVD